MMTNSSDDDLSALVEACDWLKFNGFGQWSGYPDNADPSVLVRRFVAHVIGLGDNGEHRVRQRYVDVLVAAASEDLAWDRDALTHAMSEKEGGFDRPDIGTTPGVS
jgi:hypothetical protein